MMAHATLECVVDASVVIIRTLGCLPSADRLSGPNKGPDARTYRTWRLPSVEASINGPFRR
jgi:hypothetical protein